VTVSELYGLILLFKLIEMFVLKQLDNQYKTVVLIAKQLSILYFRQDNQVPNATYSPLGWKLLVRQESATILLIFWRVVIQ
jgi:hypothetical protein